MDSVWVLSILNRMGTEFHVCESELAAEQELYEYVSGSWDENGPTEPIPDDVGEAIDLYFDENDDESYVIVERHLVREQALLADIGERTAYEQR